MSFYLYIHRRPNGDPFYVGKATSRYRPSMFSHRNAIHKNIAAKHGKDNIKIEVVEFPTHDDVLAAEIAAIAQFRAEGYFLANLTDGGEGMLGFKPSDETRRIWSEQRKGRKASAETRAKLSAIHKGNKHNLGRKLSERECELLSKRFKGIPKSESHRAKIAAAHLGKKGMSPTEETKIKMSIAHALRYTIPINREKARESAHRGWITRRLNQSMSA